jgi:hypothetical protein
MLNIDEDPISPRSLTELRRFSTFIFVFAALVIQFLMTLETAVLLKLFSYQFNYSLFLLEYVDETSKPWTEAMVTFVFGSGPLMFTILGVWFLTALHGANIPDWKRRLILTWVTYVMVNAVPCGIISGFLFFDNLGVVFQWLFESFYQRGVIALVVLIMVVYTSGFWLFLFLKTAWHPVFIASGENRRLFIHNVFTRPWLQGCLILLLFNWPFYSLYWPLFLLSLGYISFPAYNYLRAVPDLEIEESSNSMFTSRHQILYMVIGLACIWCVNFIIVRF